MVILSADSNGIIVDHKNFLFTVADSVYSNDYYVKGISIYDHDNVITLFKGTYQTCKEYLLDLYNKINLNKDIPNLVADDDNLTFYNDNKKCSKCGGQLYPVNNNMTYTSYPPKYLYKCKNCGNEEIL